MMEFNFKKNPKNNMIYHRDFFLFLFYFKYKACDIFVRGVSVMEFFANAGMIKTPDLISWLISFAIASIFKKA